MNKRTLLLVLGMSVILGGCSKESPKDCYNNGMDFYKDGKYQEAAVEFEKAVTKNPDKAEYYIAYGMSLLETEDFAKAQIQFDKAISDKDNLIVHENNKQAYRGKGIACYEAADYENAAAYFKKALEIADMEELDTDILSYKAESEMKLGSYEEALKTYEELLKRKKSDALVYGKKAQVEYLLGQTEKALKDFDKAIELDSNNYDVYFGKYYMLMDKGETADAKTVLEKALAIKANTDEDYYNVAKIHFLQGQMEAARTELAASLEKGFTEAAYYLGQISEAEEEYSEAISNYEKYIAAEPDMKSASVFNQLGMCYMKTADYENALKAFEKGIALNDSLVMQTLKSNEIAAYENLKDFVQANEKVKAYVAAYPEDLQMKREADFIKSRTDEKKKKKSTKTASNSSGEN